MPKIIIRSSLVGAVLLTGCMISIDTENSANVSYPSWEGNIDRIAHKEMKNTGIPSLQIAIGYKGDVVFERAYGFADVESKRPATIDTQYRTASISKWFTGTATMKLVDDGELDLTAPIQTYCPQYPQKKSEITTRQLLSHTAGIRHYEEGEAEETSNLHYTDVIGPLDSFKTDPLVFEPATSWRYSSHGFRVLGCVIQGAAKKPYNDYLVQSVFGPAAMNSTRPDDSTRPNMDRATGYELTRFKRLKPAPVRDVSENLPAGGHLSTASDLIRFSQSFDQGKLISPEAISLMSSSPIAKTGETIEAGYGHGVDFMGAFGGALGHGGRQEGTTTLLVLLADEDISVSVMTNTRGWSDSNEFTKKVLGNFRNGQRIAPKE